MVIICSTYHCLDFFSSLPLFILRQITPSHFPLVAFIVKFRLHFSGGLLKRRRVVRCHLIRITGPILWCQVVSCIPSPIHGWQSIAERWPLYVIGCCRVTQPAAVKKLSQFQLFLLQPKRTGQSMRKPALSPDHLIWSEHSLRLTHNHERF